MIREDAQASRLVDELVEVDDSATGAVKKQVAVNLRQQPGNPAILSRKDAGRRRGKESVRRESDAVSQ